MTPGEHEREAFLHSDICVGLDEGAIKVNSVTTVHKGVPVTVAAPQAPAAETPLPASVSKVMEQAIAEVDTMAGVLVLWKRKDGALSWSGSMEGAAENLMLLEMVKTAIVECEMDEQLDGLAEPDDDNEDDDDDDDDEEATAD